MRVVGKKKMSGGMVESPAEKNRSRSFRDAESLGLINKERINSQELSLRHPKDKLRRGEEMRNKSNGIKKGQKV